MVAVNRPPYGSLLKPDRPARSEPGSTSSGPALASHPAATEAEAVAIAALSFIAEDEDRALRFAAATGLALENLREAARDPAFLGGVLDFVLADEPLLLAAAAAQDRPPEAIALARTRLPGGSASAVGE